MITRINNEFLQIIQNKVFICGGINNMVESKINEETPHSVRLTAPEIANIWAQYQNDTMAICVYTYMIKIVEDVSIRPILEFSLRIAEGHITKIKDYFTQEKFPIPHGFTEDDVYLAAP